VRDDAAGWEGGVGGEVIDPRTMRCHEIPRRFSHAVVTHAVVTDAT
jgi:hypothetical protein